MRIGICDDERTDLDCLMAALQEYAPAADAEIVPFTDAIGLLAHEKSFDLVFMDIEMPKRNGYDAATELVRKPPKPLVIFLTNSLAYTLRGYGIAFRYLTKPIDKALLFEAMDAAVKEICANRFTFTVDGCDQILPMEEIYYFEIDNHYTILHTCDQEFTFRGSLRSILPQLPAGFFGVPHQSYIVNFSHIDSATANELRLTNGIRIPVSRRKQREFEVLLHRYLGR